MTVTGRVFNIQRFSMHDGPGIRTSIFLKGCNLACSWCHNPESRKAGQEIQSFPQKCELCMTCVEVCPTGAHTIRPDGLKVFDRSLCDQCGECVKGCLYDALVFVMKTMTVEQVVEEAMKDFDFYRNSGGGITFSGGEPLLQKEFVRAVATETGARGTHVALDTAAHVEWSDLEYVLPVIDLVLLDIKVMDAAVHKQHTGVSNERILNNAAQLGQADVDMIVRIPVIPTVNATEQNMRETAEFIKGFSRLLAVELLPYHDMGVDKHASLGHPGEQAVFETPSSEMMRKLAEPFEKQGLRVKLG